MSDQDPPPAAHEDAKAETRAAAKWLIAAFAGVGGVLVTGVGLNGLGDVEGTRLLVAVGSLCVGIVSIVAALSLITDVLTPTPVTLTDLARFANARREGSRKDRNDELLDYVVGDPTLLQGLDRPAPTAGGRQGALGEGSPHDRIAAVSSEYHGALDTRASTQKAYLALFSERGADDAATRKARGESEAASARAVMAHATIRRLEQIATGQSTIFSFQSRRPYIAGLALVVAAAIGAFAWASNPPPPEAADLRGAELIGVDLSGASLRGAELSGMEVTDSNLEGTNLEGAEVDGTTWRNTVCPDGTNSDNAGETCEGHLDPVFQSDPLP